MTPWTRFKTWLFMLDHNPEGLEGFWRRIGYAGCDNCKAQR